MRKRKFLLFFILVLVTIGVLVVVCNMLVERAAEGKLYSDVNSIPFNRVGLLLGTGKYLSDKKTVNLFYSYRIDAAVQLLKAGKIRYIVISGDNSRKEYDEPTDMRDDLIRAGIDSNVIFLDYAGFRTYDSVVRLEEVFGQQAATIISQKFHNQRAIYIANKEGIAAIGFNAQDVGNSAGLKVQAREKLARVKVFVDYLFNKKPKFLGPNVIIPE